MSWLRKLLPSNSLPIEQEAEVLGDIRSSLIARDSDVIEEFEHAEMPPQKKQRIMDEQSIVIYDQEQGSSSSSQLICHLDTLPSNSALSPKIESLKEKLGRLFARQSDVLTELKDAEFQPGQKQREEVRHWLTEVQRIKKKIQSMRNDGQGSSSNSNLSGSIESFMKEVDELIQRSKFPNGLVLFDQESTRLPLLRNIKPVGTNFQQNTEKILGLLRNHEHCIIGVYGMGGVGKTTLLMHIHDQLLKDSNLSQEIGRVYWVTVSQNCPVYKLQKDMAKALGLKDFEEEDETKRAAVLHDRITARGRTVLILDDMWEQVSGSKVGIPLENSDCKIILSTRLYDVCRKMGCKDFVIKAETLNEGEAWHLFVEKLGHYDTLEEEAKKIAWDIAKECGGLPLAIATMARSMTDFVDINEWKTAFNDLKSARNQADMEDDVFQILRYSYDRLNDKRVQQCFLNCVLYGEDAIIKRTDLIDLCLNEGLLDEIESRDAQVEKGHVMLNKLESCCLLEPSGDDCVKMHDLIRDMAIIITKEHPLFIAEAGKQLKKVPKEEKWSKDPVKVSFSHNHIKEILSGMTPMTPNLKVLMLNENPLKKIPDAFFVHMKGLTVLDLSGTEIERVPESVSDLENLRSLRLVECYELKYVPSVAKLTKLRTLELEWCCNLNKAPRGLERLGNVEKVSYIPWDASDLIGFNEVIQSLTSLNFYKFLIWDPTSSKLLAEWEYFFNSSEKAVWISGVEFGEDKSSWLLPTTLEYLRIEKCDMKGRSLEVVFPSLSEVTSMKEITILSCDGLESISGSSGTQHGSSLLYTTQLEILMLDGLSDLRSIAKLGVPHSFTRLRELDIRYCPDMKVVLPVTCSMELHLPELESIEVSECKELEEIFETNKATLSIRRIILPKLKRLELDSLPKMKVIFPFTEELHLQNLRTIKVSACKDLEEIFESSKATPCNRPDLALPNLHSIQLDDLPNLHSIWNGMLVGIPKLRKLDVRGCLKLEEAPRGLERLKWVERVSYMPWDVSSDRIRFDKVMQSLASLSFYRILIGDGDPTFLCQSFNKWRGLYEKVVWIRGGEFGEEKSSFVLPTTVKCLGIDECDMKGRCLEDVFLSLHEAAGLKQIVLSKCRELDCVAGTKQGCWSSSYPELDDLVLTGLPDLTSIAKFGPPVFFSGIRRLCISKCPKIKVVLPFRLHTLEIIEVKECDKVEEIFEANKTSPNNPPTLALPKLQSLKLEGLPNLRSIWNGMLIDTPKLRILDVRGCWKLEEARSRELERLKWVENVSYMPWDVSDSIGFNKVMQSLTSLNFYRILIGVGDPKLCESFRKWGGFYEYDKVVWIRGGNYGEDKSSFLLPTTVKCLGIVECDMKGRCLIDVFPSLGEDTGLQQIVLSKCRGLEYVTRSSGTQQRLPDQRSISKFGQPVSYYCIRRLYIIECPKLKVVLPVTCTDQVRGRVHVHLPNLEVIWVENCEEVEEIFESNKAILYNGLPALPRLKLLRLCFLPRLKVIFPFAEQLPLPGVGYNPIVCVCSLMALYIRSLPEIKVVLPHLGSGEQLTQSNLQSIEVEECYKVEEIFGKNKATLTSNSIFSLPDLKCLRLKDLPNLKVNLKQFNLSKLKRVELVNCGKIEEMFGLNKATLFNPLVALTSLEHLELCSLSKIKVIFPFTEQIHLQNLTTIKVSTCKDLEVIFESSKATPCNRPVLALPNLLSLDLLDLPNLRSISKGVLLDIPKLQHNNRSLCRYLPDVRNCPMLKLSLFLGGLVGDQFVVDDDDDKSSWSASLSLFPTSDRNPLDIDGGVVEDALLYCALFPPDLEFEKDTLVQLWIAVGFFVEEPMERFAGLSFEDYLTKGYLQFTRTNLVTGKAMYKFEGDSHILQDLISRNDLIVIMDGSSDINVISPKVSHLSIRCHNVISPEVSPDVLCGLKRFKHLRTLILFHGHKMSFKHLSYDFFVMLRQLQVLDLSKTHLMELPSSIGIMKCLCFLDLSDTLITRLPEAIDCLEKLQTLKLRGCSNLFTLPKGMRRLVNLRHLEFDVFRQLRSMPEGMGDLTNIQTLSAFLVGVEEGCSIRQIKKMNNLSGSFCISRLENVLTKDEAEEACLSNKTQLKKMELHWSDSQDEDGDSEDEDVVGCGEVLSSLRPNASLEELNISCFGGSELPWWICDPAFSKLVSITLFECENCSALPSLGLLPALKYLNIVNFHKLMVIDQNFFGDIGIRGYIAFPKLEKLTVENMLSLEEWSGIRSFEFPSLLNFTVKHCPSFEFPSLLSFTVKHCPKLRNLCTLSSLSSLQYLEISHCAMLAFPEGKLPSQVETFIIEDCPLISSSLLNEDLNWQKVAHIPHKWIDHQEISHG